MSIQTDDNNVPLTPFQVPFTPSQFPFTPGPVTPGALYVQCDSQAYITEEQNVFPHDEIQQTDEFISVPLSLEPLHRNDPLHPVHPLPFDNDEANAEYIFSRIDKRDENEKRDEDEKNDEDDKRDKQVKKKKTPRNEGLGTLQSRKPNGAYSLLVDNDMKIHFLECGESIYLGTYSIGDTIFGKSMPEFRIHNESDKTIRVKMRLCIRHKDNSIWRGNVFPYSWRESGGQKNGVTNKIPSGKTYVFFPSRPMSQKADSIWMANAKRWMKEQGLIGKASSGRMYQLLFELLEDKGHPEPPVTRDTIYTDFFAFNTGRAPRDKPEIAPAPQPEKTTAGKKRLPPSDSPTKVAKLEQENKALKSKISGLEEKEKTLKNDIAGHKNVVRLKNMNIKGLQAELREKDMIIHDLEYKLKETERDADYMELAIDQEVEIGHLEEKINELEKTAAAPPKKPALVVSKYAGFAKFMMDTLQDIRDEEDAQKIKERLGSFILDPKTSRFLTAIGQPKLDPAVAKLIPSDVARSE